MKWEKMPMQEGMHAVRISDLPRIGSSYNFVGADQGNVPISIYLVEAEPGRGAPLHVHEYDEIVIVQEGLSRFVVADQIREAGPGEILVVKAGIAHGFANIGAVTLRQVDIHASPHFRQARAEPTETSRRAALPE